MKLVLWTFLAERREALKAELDGLRGDPKGQKKSSAAAEPSGTSASKGSVTLQELRLPLKADFVCSIANKPGRLQTLTTGDFVVFKATLQRADGFYRCCFRIDQTFLLPDDPRRSREHRGYAFSQHPPGAQWGHPGLPHQVHHVSPIKEHASFDND